MKIYREITPLQANDVFVLCHYNNACFNYPLHNHREYELCLTLNSRGNRIVGDSVAKYSETDLVLIGPDIYHRWDNEELKEYKKSDASVLVIQFGKNLFENNLLSKEAFYPIRRMLKLSERGIEFYGATREIAVKQLLNLSKTEGFKAVLDFLSILNDLALSKERHLLASEGFAAKSESMEHSRINSVFKYIADHFTERLQISRVARIANMSESAFSHFFKKCTNKSFTKYLVELRIGLACRLLVESRDTISQICFRCGFNNVSNFNRLFKKYKGTTPLTYRRTIEEQVSRIDYQNRFV